MRPVRDVEANSLCLPEFVDDMTSGEHSSQAAIEDRKSSAPCNTQPPNAAPVLNFAR